MGTNIAIGNLIGKHNTDTQKINFPFSNSLVDYWNFKGKNNSDEDRDTIKGIKGGILTAYNLGWSLGSGYGLYKENYNNFRQLSGTTGVFTNTDHSIRISNVNAVNIPVTEIPYKAGEISPEYQIKVTGLLEGQQCSIGYFYNYAGNTKPSVQKNLIDIPKDGIYTVPSFTFPSDIKSGTATRIVFNFAGDTDITIEQIPEYEGAIVTDGIDDYLKLDKVGYKIGTVILRYTTLFRDNNWRYIFDVQQERSYLASNKETGAFVTSMQYKFAGDHMYLIPRTSNNPTISNTPLYIGSNSIVTESARMALYEIAIYEDILTEEEVQKEIEKMNKV